MFLRGCMIFNNLPNFWLNYVFMDNFYPCFLEKEAADKKRKDSNVDHVDKIIHTVLYQHGGW